jgi:flavin reductase (DIM6/NTAB) family NADH-FMN oxidoreductase RutF
MSDYGDAVPGNPVPDVSVIPAASRQAFLEVMASVCTPVSVVTAMSADDLPYGTTVSAFASLSLNPPMIMIALDRDSELLGVIRRAGRLGINLLGSHQSELARTFARKGGPAKFAGVAWLAEDGVPRIPGDGGFLSATVDRLVPGGDHIAVLASVGIAQAAGTPPLTYHNRVFGTHAALDANVA